MLDREFTTTAIRGRPWEADTEQAASERPNFNQHRVGQTPKRVRMEARSNVSRN